MKLSTVLLTLSIFELAASNVISKSANSHFNETVSPSLEEHLQWSSWKNDHAQEYDSLEEELYRLSIWVSNMRYIKSHNQEAEKHGFTLKINSFGDRSALEWSNYHICHKYDSYNTTNSTMHHYVVPSNLTKDIPSWINWRKLSKVTRIKNQEEYRCHACYAFAATGALEGALAIKTGTLVSLSEQQIMDCSGQYGNSACNGGNYKFAWNYIINNGGIDKSRYYRYRSSRKSCKFRTKFIATKMSSFATIEQGNEYKMMAAVGLSGPAAVTIDHKRRDFQFYSSGVYTNIYCSSNRMNATHEMLVVGYGTTSDNKPYWIVKNSYGKNWGKSGYMNILRGANMCGIASNAAIPII